MVSRELKHVSKDTDVEIIKRILDDAGCVVVDNVLDSKEVFNLGKELSPYLEKTPNCQGEFFGYKTTRVSSLMKKSKTCQDMAINNIVLDVMDYFLKNEYSDHYQINLTQAIAIGSGEGQQIIHRDDPMFPFMHAGYESMVNCMWALDDFTEKNGATMLVPGSHKWKRNTILDTTGENRIPNSDDIVQAVMKRGSVLIYLGSLYHCGGENMTKNQTRRGVVISYSLGWLKQAENSFLAYSLDTVRQFPETLQRLLGYFVHTPNLGSVEGQDPIRLVQSGISENERFNEFLPEEATQFIKEYKKQQKEVA